MSKPRALDIIQFIEARVNVVPFMFRYVDENNNLVNFNVQDLMSFSLALDDTIEEYRMIEKRNDRENITLRSLIDTQRLTSKIYGIKYEQEIKRFKHK